MGDDIAFADVTDDGDFSIVFPRTASIYLIYLNIMMSIIQHRTSQNVETNIRSNIACAMIFFDRVYRT